MKLLGMIGGMSWESTLSYYRIINETVKARLGGFHSARLVLYNVDFHDVERMQRTGDWDTAGRALGEAARAVEAAGAESIVLCTNTMHKVASAIETAVRIPLLHIADATAEAIKRSNVSTVGLLGTRFTMEQGFYKDRLRKRHGVSVLTPDQRDRDAVHRIVYEELCLGRIEPESRSACQRIIGELVSRGAEAVILGCTEISLLVAQRDVGVPLFDTTAIHATKAAEWALDSP